MIMHRIVLVMICAVMVGEYLTTLLGLPRVVKLLPEILTLLTAFFVVVAGVRNQFRFVAGKYWLAFGLMVFIMLSGILINQVGTGPTVAGMRYYFRAIPFFFLPAVIDFTDEQIKQQFKLLLALAFLQVPTAIYQRVILMNVKGWGGDSVTGTLQISSILSIFLICVVLVLVGLRIRGRIGAVVVVLVCFLLLIPTMINETKGTAVLLPIGLIVALLVGAKRGERLRIVTWAAVLLVGFGAVFVPVYDYMNRNRPYAVSITQFFTDKETLTRYVDKKSAGVGATRLVGRVDAITVPLEYLSHNPTRLMFGLGLGNVSHSQLGQGFTGEYYQLFKYVAVTSESVFLLETGLLGLATIFLFYWMIVRDAITVARYDQEMRGSLAVGWVGVTVVFALATFYKTIHGFESLSYLFWYFSGLVAARRVQLSIRHHI